MAKSYIQSGPRVSASAGHVQPDIADVTDVRASVPEAVEVDGVVKAKVTITYKTPVILGEGDVKFTGVRVRIQRSSSIVEGESFVAAGEPASEESFDLLVSYSDTPEDQVIYLCSQSEKYTDLLVTKPKTGEKPGVTPNAAISLPANPLKGNAPDVLAFDAGTTDPPTGSFIRSGRWDRLNEKMLVDWGCLLPSELINWSGVAVFVKVPNGNFIQATGVIGRDDFTPAANGFPAHYDCIAIEGADLPAVPENWHYIAVSYDRSGRPNKDAEGNPTGPAIIVPTLQPKEKPDFNRPENPASVDFTSSIVG